MGSEILRRRMSGKGQLIIPEENRKWKQLWLTVVRVREPRNKYSNYEWNAEESLYGRLQFTNVNGIVTTHLCKYPLQTWCIWNNQEGQNLLAMKCAYAGVLQSFSNLGVRLGFPITQFENGIENFKLPLCDIESVLWSTYSTGAVELVLTGENYEFCDITDVDSYTYPEITLPEEVGVDTPVVVSGCNDGSPIYPCDNGFTDPNELDTQPVEPPSGFPIGQVGETWRITGQIREVDGIPYFGGSDRTTVTRDLLAPITFFGFFPDSGLAGDFGEFNFGFAAAGVPGDDPGSGSQKWVSQGGLSGGFSFEFTLAETEKL